MQRRKFIQSAVLAPAALTAIAVSPEPSQKGTAVDDKGVFVIGPVEGYSPQIGTLVSMMNYNRSTIINTTKNLTMTDLDYLQDDKANTIGALIMHLGAVDKWYQLNSFEGRDELTDGEKEIWEPALNLGDAGRKKIKVKN